LRFLPISSFVLETIRDTTTVALEHKQLVRTRRGAAVDARCLRPFYPYLVCSWP